jgi:hypothetical protein
MKFLSSSLLWIIAAVFLIVVDGYCDAGDASDADDCFVVVAETTNSNSNSNTAAAAAAAAADVNNNDSLLLPLSDHNNSIMTSNKSFLPTYTTRRRVLVDNDDYGDDDDYKQKQQQGIDDFTNGSITNDVEPLGILDEYNNTDNDDLCDESKCVSTGLSRSYFSSTFTCYSDGTWYNPMMCADGYKPRIVENETANYSYDYLDFSELILYFTCCPPNLSPDADVSRHCSNPTSINGHKDPINETTVCDDPTKPYHRQMKTRKDPWSNEFFEESYICCNDYIINNQTINNNNQTTHFLDEVECVPYNNQFYERSWIYNLYGELYPGICDEPESGFDFDFPRYYVEHYYGRDYDYYECCKTKIGSSIFFQDLSFKSTVYPQIAISAIAVVSSMVLIVALLIPLLNKWLIKFRETNTPSTPTRATTRSAGRRTRTQATSAEPAYSSYNLYLVYLAIPDLILNFYLLIMYGSYANQNYNPSFHGTVVYSGTYNGVAFEGALIVACSTANLVRNVLLFNCLFKNLHI